MKTIEQIERRKAQKKDYYLRNIEKIRASAKEYYVQNADTVKAYKKDYYLQNPDKIKANMKEYQLKNAEKLKDYFKEYRLKNADILKDQRKENYLQNSKQKMAYNKVYTRKRRQEDPNFRLISNLRSRIVGYCRNIKIEKNFRTINALGCTAQEFKEHLERLFQMGMTWENYGLGGWVVDHIKPISLAKTIDEVYLLNHYTNLQPMWELDNLVKHNKYIEPTLQLVA